VTIRTWNRSAWTLRLVAMAAAVTVTVLAAPQPWPGGSPPAQKNAMTHILAGTKPANCGTPNTPPCADR